MFAKIKNSVIDFIVSDVKSEAETKELPVLLRILCIIFAVYYLTISIMIAAQGFYILALILVFALGILTGSFICTYENKTKLSLRLFNFVILVISSLLSLTVSFTFSYHWIIFITIFLFFYDYTSSLRFKIYYSVFVALWMVALTLFCLFNPVLKPPVFGIQIAVLTLTILVIVLSMSCIAYFYCSKFTDSESKIMQYNKKLLQMASLDSLTQLPNRRTMNEHLQDLVFSTSRSGEPFCIAIGDVDFFKHINDEYGHETGDYVLCTLASSFQDYMHGKGMIARWGGEEFLFTFEKVHIGQALYDLRKLGEAIADYNFHYKEYHFRLTMTFGLDEYSEHLGVEAVISRADTKLYYGKENGRNRVVDRLPT